MHGQQNIKISCVVIETSATWSPCKNLIHIHFYKYCVHENNFQLNKLRLIIFQITPKILSCMTQNTVRVHCYDISVILFRDVIAIYCEHYAEHINVMLQKFLTATNDRRYIFHWASTDYIPFKLNI